jgi:hypothetical protein
MNYKGEGEAEYPAKRCEGEAEYPAKRCEGEAEYSQENIYQSKLATEQGLLNIGRAQLIKEQDIVNKIKIKTELLEQIRDYKNKSLLVSSIAIVNKVDKYLEILSLEEQEYVKKLKCLEEENDCFKEEAEDSIKEIEELETKIETYWKQRVLKLRSKCIEKNNEIYKLKLYLKLLFIIYVIIIFVTNFSNEIYSFIVAVHWVFASGFSTLNTMLNCMVTNTIQFINYTNCILTDINQFVDYTVGIFIWMFNTIFNEFNFF